MLWRRFLSASSHTHYYASIALAVTLVEFLALVLPATIARGAITPSAELAVFRMLQWTTMLVGIGTTLLCLFNYAAMSVLSTHARDRPSEYTESPAFLNIWYWLAMMSLLATLGLFLASIAALAHFYREHLAVPWIHPAWIALPGGMLLVGFGFYVATVFAPFKESASRSQ